MKKIVLFGMMSNKAVAGIAHLTMPYVVGLERLGYEAFYVEAHGSWPTQLQDPDDKTGDGSMEAVAYIERVVRSFGFEGRWAYHALHSDGACYGMSSVELRRLYETADLFLNLHGGTCPPEELAGDDRLVLIDTDPVGFQIDACQGKEDVLELLGAHAAFFSWGENLGNPDCRVPIPPGIRFRPTRIPVLLDLWDSDDVAAGEVFTTIGNWQQRDEDIEYEGETYHWSKHHEFLKFLQLPARTEQLFELALASYDDDVLRMLEEHGWHVRPAAEISYDLDAYRRYILGSRGEFTVAKDQNVRLRSGWFSDRSATYLASGRPVITQETGFSNALPTGEGLFGFSTMDEILAAIDEINSDYTKHSTAAREIAREYFDANRVLARLLENVGLASRQPARAQPFEDPAPGALPKDLVLDVVSRRPLELPAQTVARVRNLEAPRDAQAQRDFPKASIVIVTFGDLVPTRLCMESILDNTDRPPYEVIVVDNGSSEEARLYLGRIASQQPHVHALFNDENLGFARACNLGLEAARGEILVLLNNDTIVPPSWLAGLVRPLEDPGIGLVGPVTNRIGNEAEILAWYQTYGELLEFAAERRRNWRDAVLDIGTATMFCLAMRRDTFERVGPLDERFEVGLLEDDDYSLRAREAGYRIVCAEDVFVHHFGEASFGALFATGEYNDVLAANKHRFEEKWGTPWKPYRRRQERVYEEILERVRETVRRAVPAGAHVLVASRGDERLLDLDGRRAGHFPQESAGVYAGHYPADGRAAVVHLERLRANGAEYLVFPSTSLWWLDHYRELASHLQNRYRELVRDDDTCAIFALGERDA